MDKENAKGRKWGKMKINKKVICLFLLLLLSLIIVINIGNSKVSLIGRDAPKGNIFCFISFCNEAKNIYSVFGVVAGEAEEDIVSLIGVSAGEAGGIIFSLIGVSAGKAGGDIFSLIGVSAGEAGKAVRGLIVVRELHLWPPVIELSVLDY
ncbi:MAG: hypothetical protein U9O20_04390 [Patescibacteria group bacterium]|nr:hypothetical protein [Patescibacteria group bacterium]